MQSNASLPTSQPEQRRPRRRRRRSGFLPSQPQPLQQPQLQSNSDFDKAYFDCYAHLGVHEEMIKDRVRTETYRNAIMHYQDLIKGRVVLDVGCGTGILSIFCAQAGAKQVFAVEASDIALQAANVVEANNLSSIITVLHQRIEDVELKEKVDVIISEWMGYMLLHESMLGSVITARDRWLKPGGLILPSNATLYMAPFTHSKRHRENIDFWRNVYGIDMSAMIPLAKQHALEEPSVETISGENILTLPHGVKYIDCYSITISELQSISTIFKFNSMVKAPLHGFAFWFDVDFTNMGPVAPMPVGFQVSTSPVDNHTVNGSQGNGWRKRNLFLSTAPEDPPTHWQQTLIYFLDPLELEQNQLIEGKVTLSQNQLHARFLNISLEYSSGDQTVVKETLMR